MPQAFERAGTFRVKVLDHGVGTTSKNSYPQLVLKVEATEW